MAIFAITGSVLGIKKLSYGRFAYVNSLANRFNKFCSNPDCSIYCSHCFAVLLISSAALGKDVSFPCKPFHT